MLTLKIVTTDVNGQVESHVFSGDSISHREYFSTDHRLARKKLEENDTIWCINSMEETSSEQKFTASEIFIYDEDRNLKHFLLVFPKADCYIMENGKTIDSFYSRFEL